MKKSTLLTLLAAATLTASAQYTAEPTVETVLKGGKVTNLEYVVLDETSVNTFQSQGAKIENFGPDNETRNLYIWPGGETFAAGDGGYPGVGMHFDGYVSLVVTGFQGWSGAGFSIGTPGVNTTSWTADTRFHLAYMSPGTVCPSVGLIIANGENECGSVPAKVSLGTAFTDNGVAFPAIAPAPGDDWQGIDISFADLKKIWPLFDFKAITTWNGNVLSFLCGGVAGQTIAFDAVYFYNTEFAGVESVEAENDWVVTANTINVNGGSGIELYNLAGQKVKATQGSTLGIDNLTSGVYVARCGNKVQKIVK